MKQIGYFNLISLGCPKNRVDSEKILHAMLTAGFEHTEDTKSADILVINTCSFIQPAVEESISAILDNASENPDAFLIVAGCLPLRYGESLRELLPEVDLFIKPEQIGAITELIRSRSPEIKIAQISSCQSINPLVSSDRGAYEFNRALSTPGYAYLRIADGCDHACKFCAIPLIRGKLRSEAIDDLVREAQELTDRGVKEIVLVAQDLTSYGRDLGLKDGLIRLLEKLDLIRGIDWIRLMYLYPSGVTSDLIHTIRDSKKILPYLDVPIQHVSDWVLKSMGRPWRGAHAQIKKLIDLLRSEIPEIVIRTSLMVGFPTEADYDFDELKNFLKQFELDHVGVFTYFQEEGAPADKLGDPIPKKVKNSRARALRSIHSMFIKKKNKKRIGSIEQAIVEGFSEETELLLQGRLWDQAPEIDGKLYITDGTATVGEITKV
ncbi:MAG: 30S ribosomal protein S12 methylthiotransferase RimO, partial [Deltaproteobacteria bacterium]|nr:30S ribosomal protein S12 methylthiotransferase RimO [Deltaproteobacteria bacterium]